MNAECFGLFARRWTARLLTLASAVVLGGTASTGAARGDITGFNQLNGWNYVTNDSNSPPALIGTTGIQLTSGFANQRAVWFATRQDIRAFRASFTYRATGISGSSEPGIGFCLQNAGPAALGANYGFALGGLAPSAAVVFIYHSALPSGSRYAGVDYASNGVFGSSDTSIAPVDLNANTDIRVVIDYAGTALSVSMTQGVNTFTRSYFVGSLPAILGGNTAYVGFSSGRYATIGGASGGNQFLSNFTFTSTSAPAACSLADVASVGGSVGPDGQLSADDVIAFLGGFLGRTSVGDVASVGGTRGADGQWTADDIIVFLAAYFAGC